MVVLVDSKKVPQFKDKSFFEKILAHQDSKVFESFKKFCKDNCHNDATEASDLFAIYWSIADHLKVKPANLDQMYFTDRDFGKLIFFCANIPGTFRNDRGHASLIGVYDPATRDISFTDVHKTASMLLLELYPAPQLPEVDVLMSMKDFLGITGGFVTNDRDLDTYKSIDDQDGYLPRVTRAENGNIRLDACYIRGQMRRYTENKVIEIGVKE